MKWIDRLAEKLLARIPDNRIRIEAEMRSDGRLRIKTGKLKRETLLFQPKSYQDWIDAVYAATAEEPNLFYLHDLYQNLLLDAHLQAVINTRIHRVLRSKFLIRDKEGNIYPELLRLFRRPWFEQFLTEVLMSKFTGIKVIEMFELDEELELKKINSIPLSHIKPNENKIVFEASGNEGYYYNKPPYDRFYIQIGESTDLGMLAQLAPLILAKKLSMGSWLDYIEKYGVAPIYITTDNHTNKRAQELFEMGKKFFSNYIAVIRSGEEIKIGNMPNTDTYRVFDQMIKRVNSEISKAILGQDATTTNQDSKGTYGSLKVMQKVANDRHESDKLFVENIINKKLIPKLSKLSSRYAELDGKQFDWDKTEQIDNATYLDRIIRLKQAGFELDIEQIKERTGIPVIGMEQVPEGSKKKALT